MNQPRVSEQKVQRIFRGVALAALVAAFVQVTLGGVVRVTGSGLGCPDWPLCHGRIIPPFEAATLIEYTHRLSASALSVLALAVALLAWLSYRSNRWILYSSIVGLCMVIAAAALGGATVLTALAWWVRLFHLGIAETVVAAMVVVSVVGWKAKGTTLAHEQEPVTETERLNYLVMAALIGVFALILSGSFIVGYGAGASCPTWPLCNGSLFPEGTPYAVHMGHRLFAALVGVLVAATAVAAWSRRARRPALGRAGLLLSAAFAGQMLLGAAVVWAGFAPAMKALHLSAATLVWMALVFLAALVYTPQRLAFRQARRVSIQAAEMERLTP